MATLKALGSVLMLAALAVAAQERPALRWYKGNTHTHTTLSDGDSSPEDVTRWYKDHGYNFLVLTDHNVLQPVDELNATLGVPGSFLVIKGEEVTNRLTGKGVHVNGLDTRSRIGAQQ